MADNEFDLGEAYGAYERAQADRNFYLSMVQGGNQAASPIAAYLAGVANVKMAKSREQMQRLQDEKQAQKDAIAATERARNYGNKLRDNLVNIVSAANQGDIAKGSAATMVGMLVKEMGYTPTEYDADNGIVGFRDANGEDYELDLSQYGMSKRGLAEGRLGVAQSREARIAGEQAGKAESDAEYRKWRNEYMKKRAQGEIGSGSKQGYTTLSSFNTTHKATNNALDARVGRDTKLNSLSKAQIQSFIEGADSLSPADKKQVQPKVDELMRIAKNKGWTFSSPTTQEVDLTQIWNQ